MNKNTQKGIIVLGVILLIILLGVIFSNNKSDNTPVIGGESQEGMEYIEGNEPGVNLVEEEPTYRQNGEVVEEINWDEVAEKDPLTQFKMGVDVLGNPITKEEQELWISQIENSNQDYEEINDILGKKNINDDFDINTNIKISNGVIIISDAIENIFTKENIDVESMILAENEIPDSIELNPSLIENSEIAKGTIAYDIIINRLIIDTLLKTDAKVIPDGIIPDSVLDIEFMYLTDEEKNSYLTDSVSSNVGGIQLGNYTLSVNKNYYIVDVRTSESGERLPTDNGIVQELLGSNLFEIEDIYKK